MTQLGVSCPRGCIPWSECLGSCVHNPDHPCDWTADMLSLLRQEDSDQPSSDAFTPTRLLGCSRQQVLLSEHDHYTDINQSWPLVRGNMVHALMESASYPGAVGVVREQRFQVEIETPYGPQLFSAKPDLIVLKEFISDSGFKFKVKIVDYKSTGKIDNQLDEPKIAHQLQVNMYAWIVTQCLSSYLETPSEIDVDELEIVYADFSSVRRFTSAGSREVPCRRKVKGKLVDDILELAPIRRWSMDAIGRYIQAKIVEKLEARAKLPDILEGDDAWICRYCPVRDICYEIGNVEWTIEEYDGNEWVSEKHRTW